MWFTWSCSILLVAIVDSLFVIIVADEMKLGDIPEHQAASNILTAEVETTCQILFTPVNCLQIRLLFKYDKNC